VSATITATYVPDVPAFYALEDEADALRYLAAYVEHVAARGADADEIRRTRDHASALFIGWLSVRKRWTR
jgi:hypothetical protein